MIRELGWKPDFGRTIDRFAAWWAGAVLDRPPLTLTVKPTRPAQGLIPGNSPDEKPFTVDYVVDSEIARLAQFDYVGDHYPIFQPGLGPELTPTLFMDESRNGPDCAYLDYLSNKEPVLIPAVINDCLDWQRLIDTPHEVMQRFNQDSWLFTQQVMQAAIDRNAGRYVVGLPNLYGPYDTLAALREPLALCLDLLDCPALVQQAAHSVLAGLTAVRDVFWRQIRTAGFGSAGWIPAYSEEAVGLLSCDFWGLLAPATVEALILPLLQQEMQPFNHCLFHLDGPSALSHLDLLLALPGLDAIQWDYGPGQGPAARWLKTYRRIQAAGKSLQVLAQDAADALTVLETLGGKGVWLTIEQPFVSRGEVDSFMKEVARKS